MSKIGVYEELRQDGVTYVQSEGVTRMCYGCAFHDTGGNCHGNEAASDICCVNNTIWIKKVNEVKEEPMNTTQVTKEFTAPNMLKRASDLMIERAAQYDSPEGERSMEKIITAFNAITGKELTESEGWMLMVLLKLVRDNTRVAGHQDSCEDLIAYSALYGESRLNKKEPQMDWDAC